MKTLYKLLHKFLGHQIQILSPIDRVEVRFVVHNETLVRNIRFVHGAYSRYKVVISTSTRTIVLLPLTAEKATGSSSEEARGSIIKEITIKTAEEDEDEDMLFSEVDLRTLDFRLVLELRDSSGQMIRE